MNSRANIMSFIEHFCDMATKEDHLPYVRMLQRDILRVVDAVVPPDGTGAANVQHVRRVLSSLQSKSVFSAETVSEIDAALRDRETQPEHLDMEEVIRPEDRVRSKTTPQGKRLDKRQIEQRIEEDRERNKRYRESMWAVSSDDMEEWYQIWDETSDVNEDDYIAAAEEAEERHRCLDELAQYYRSLEQEKKKGH